MPAALLGNAIRRLDRGLEVAPFLNAMLREHEELRQRSDQLAAEVHKLEQRVGALAERRTRQRRSPLLVRAPEQPHPQRPADRTARP